LAARRRSGAALGFAVVLGFGAATMLFAGLSMPRDVGELVGSVGLLGTAGAGFVLAFVGAVGLLATTAASGALPGRWTMLIAVLGLLTAGGGGAVLRGWLDGVYPYRVAALAALAVALAGIVAAGWLGYRFGRQPASPPAAPAGTGRSVAR
jgi:hypothetical protein